MKMGINTLLSMILKVASGIYADKLQLDMLLLKLLMSKD